MPPPLLFDIDTIDLDQFVVTREQIYQELPHRHEFMQLDGIVHIERQTWEAVAVRTIKENEFWAKGHIPGRPIFPGILMMESAAQLASYVASRILDLKGKFLGFGGVDEFKFRVSPVPPTRMVILAKLLEARTRRIVCRTQGLVDGKMAFEGSIIGMPL